jgi:hypothetical protein
MRFLFESAPSGSLKTMNVTTHNKFIEEKPFRRIHRLQLRRKSSVSFGIAYAGLSCTGKNRNLKEPRRSTE